MKYSKLVERIAGDGADVWNIHYEARRAQERGEDVILLSVGDPDLDTPSAVVERGIERLRQGDTHYTPAAGRESLRAAIAGLHQTRSAQAVDADNVIFLAGAQNALFAASLCVAGPGDEVIAFEPLYPTYPATIEVSGARLIRAAARAADGFRIDVDALETLITARTRAIFFASPNNPSGVIVGEADLARIGALAVKYGLWLVVDEVYAGLAPGGRVPSLAAALPAQVITIGSLSKSHAMPGWRAGWLVGPKVFVKHAQALAMCMLYGLPGFVQDAALTALGMAQSAEARMREYCDSRRGVLLEAFADVPQLRCHEPDAGMFMLVDVTHSGLNGAAFVQALYAAERVSVIDGGAFGKHTANFIRVCFAADRAVLHDACTRIRRFAASLEFPLQSRQCHDA